MEGQWGGNGGKLSQTRSGIQCLSFRTREDNETNALFLSIYLWTCRETEGFILVDRASCDLTTKILSQHFAQLQERPSIVLLGEYCPRHLQRERFPQNPKISMKINAKFSSRLGLTRLFTQAPTTHTIRVEVVYLNARVVCSKIVQSIICAVSASKSI